jgi:hypothetical protein
MTFELNVVAARATCSCRTGRRRSGSTAARERESDGVMQINGRGPVRYERTSAHAAARARARARSRRPTCRRGPGVRRRAHGDLTDRATSTAHRGAPPEETSSTRSTAARAGRPDRHFLKRSKAGTARYFASAAAMMLAARGDPGTPRSRARPAGKRDSSPHDLVRADNLHAWVEADLDGTGFQVLDPTPPAGCRAAAPVLDCSRGSRRSARRSSSSTTAACSASTRPTRAGAAETVRERLSDAASSLTDVRAAAARFATAQNVGLVLVGCRAIWLAWRPGATRARGG